MIITVASMKGGVGKTTTAVHIAAYLAESGKTALVDGDPNQSATGWAQRAQPGKPLPFSVLGLYSAPMEAARYDHLVMDTKARPDLEELRQLVTGCNLLVIPTTPDSLGLEGMKLTMFALEQLKSNNYRVLLTLIPPHPMMDGAEARKSLEEAKVPIFGTGIRFTKAFRTAAVFGTTVGSVAGPIARQAAQDYMDVGLEIETAYKAARNARKHGKKN